MSVKVSGNLVTNSAPVLRAAVRDGQGIVLAPTFIGLPDLADKLVVPLLTDHRPITFAINASYPTRHHLSSKVRTFLDLAAAHFARHRAALNPD